MKRKFTKILGVVLPLVMVLALAVALIPASAPPTEAAVGQARFSLIPLPKYEVAGRYVLTPDTDVGPIGVTPTGDTVFAAADIDTDAISALLKSTDGGYAWTLQSAFKTTAGDNGDTTAIVAIAASPEYATDTTVFVATEANVYQSVDGGSAFTAMTSRWGTDETITDMDVTLDEGGRLSVIVGTSAGVVDVVLVDKGDATAEWSTEEVHSGSYSAKLTIPEGATWGDAARVQVTYGELLSTLTNANITYWYSYDGTPHNSFVRLDIDADGNGIRDHCLISQKQDATVYDGTWTVTTQTDYWQRHTVNEATQVGTAVDWNTLANQITAIGSPATATVLDMLVMLGPTSVPQIATESMYIDDITIDGVTYDLEPDGGHTYLGDVYVYCPATTGMSWKAQDIGAFDVLAAAFSPNFADDEGIFAVVNDNTMTKIQVAFGSTKTGGEWGDSIGDGTFLNADAEDITDVIRARIAFPDDFDVDSTLSNIAFVGLCDDDTDATGEEGDVYKVTLVPTRSTTEDLNVRGLVSTIRTATNIWSIDVSGDAAAATIIVGTNKWTTGAAVGTYLWLTYYSTDSGVNWSTAREKSPTGAARGAVTPGSERAYTEVVMAPDFATTGVAYAATQGDETSAFSRTADGGKSFNQISLIDYSDTTDFYTVTDFDPNPMFSSTPTAYMVTVATVTEDQPFLGWDLTSRGSVWKTTNGGGKWERIWSYANPTVTDTLYKTEIIGSTVFAEDFTVGRFWRSSDDGATFPRVINAKTGYLTVVSVIDEITIWTASGAGAIWSTTKLGRPWVKPDESDVEGEIPTMYWSHGDKIIVSTLVGKVFISTDAGVTYTNTVGISDLPGYSAAVFANDYADTGYLYSLVAGGGIWRIELNEDDPDSTEWKQIDATSAGAGTVYSFFGFQLAGPTLYYWDYAPVNTDANVGGFWRCVNPGADIDGIYPPVFEKTQTGLRDDMEMGYAGYGIMPNTIFMKDSVAAGTDECHNQVYAFGDVLSSPATLVLPDDGAADQGIQLDLTLITQTVVLGWETMPLATKYRVQVSPDDGFASLTFDSAIVTGTQQRVSSLIPGLTYYWRVRAETPLMSPWSETRSFVVTAFEPTVAPVVFDIVSPELGATDVSILPTFVWDEVEGVTSYELVVAEDPTFAIIDWSRTSANPFYKAEEALAYSTTYAWKVRAADGEWATGIFTTEAAPVEPVEPIVIEPTEPAEIKIVEVPGAAPIPAYLLWTIVGVGAVLFIALIVLIVRTRRVV